MRVTFPSLSLRRFLVVLAAVMCFAVVPGSAWAATMGPFEVEGPEVTPKPYSWDGTTLTISGDGVTIEGMANPDAPAGAVVVAENVKTVGIGANVRISTLTVKHSATFVVRGTNNEVFAVDTKRDDAIGGDGSLTIETGDAGLDVFDSATVRVDGPIKAAYVWEKATLVLGPHADVEGPITVYGGVLDLSQVVIGEPVRIGGIGVGNPNTTLAIAAPFGATDLHQLLQYSNLQVYDATPVYENGEKIGTLNTDGSFNITATREVTFTGFDGQPIETQTVTLFGAATAPEMQAPDGYRFTGWDRTFDYVTENMTVAAQFEQLPAPEPQPEPAPEQPPTSGPTVGISGSTGSTASQATPARPALNQHVAARKATLPKTGDPFPLEALAGLTLLAAATIATATIATKRRRMNH